MYAFNRTDAALDIARIEAEAHALRSQTIARAGRGAARFVANVFAAIGNARRMDAMYRELNAMSDRELRDMGISRGDIPAVVAGTFTRGPAIETVAVTPAVEKKTAPRTAIADDDVRIAA